MCLEQYLGLGRVDLYCALDVEAYRDPAHQVFEIDIRRLHDGPFRNTGFAQTLQKVCPIGFVQFIRTHAIGGFDSFDS